LFVHVIKILLAILHDIAPNFRFHLVPNRRCASISFVPLFLAFLLLFQLLDSGIKRLSYRGEIGDAHTKHHDWNVIIFWCCTASVWFIQVLRTA